VFYVRLFVGSQNFCWYIFRESTNKFWVHANMPFTDVKVRPLKSRRTPYEIPVNRAGRGD